VQISTSWLLRARHPQFSPDGEALAYLDDGQVWMVSFSGGEPWQLTGLPGGISECDWAPGGRSIVVVAREAADAPPPLISDDQLPTAHEVPPLEAEEVEAPPALDAGDWVPAEPEVTVEEEEAAADPEGPVAQVEEPIEMKDAAGYRVGAMIEPVDEQATPPRPLPVVITRLTFKADGTGYIGTRPQHLFVIDVPTTASVAPARRVTGGRFSDGSPRCSPDGRWIAFSSNRTEAPDTNNNSDVWLVASRGGPALRVTESAGSDGSPRWSPDGTHLVYRHTPRDPAVYANDRLRLISVLAHPAEGGAVEIETGTPVELTAGLDRPLGSAAQWASDQASVFVTL